MARTTVAPIARAIVQILRADAALKAALTGGIHEGIAPIGSKFPWLTYAMHYGPSVSAWGSTMLTPGWDIFVFSRDQVEARNLDQLVVDILQDAELSVEGQSTLLCRRVLDMSSADIDDEGQKVYQVGGVFETWTDQTS